MTPATALAAPRRLEAENLGLSAKLLEYADLIEAQRANPFRVLAYRRAADAIDKLAEPASQVLHAAGKEGLDAIPGVGPRIASALSELISTGGWSQLDRVRGRSTPETLFRTIPGIGPVLAHRLSEDLHLSSLEGLELAAHDGRLAETAGWGERRLAMVRSVLAERLGRRRLAPVRPLVRPPVSLLLDVDREYRERADRGDLQKIAPRRFNPTGAAWLPILHTERQDWRFTALFSNTALAHRLGRTRDWVVIFAETDCEPEVQCTVVTETHGAQAGLRVVRGRENEPR